MKKNFHLLMLTVIFVLLSCGIASADTAATHIYHNHMPNFWPYYDTSKYDSTSIGLPIRYMYDAQVIELKKSPPANYPYYLPNGTPMPHDDLVTYYSHHAKTGAYLYWPWQTAEGNYARYPYSQTQVTMSGAVVNNVNDLNTLKNVSGYDNPNWGIPWKNTYSNLLTRDGKKALDLIHFTGHHTMGPLVGDEYFLKDLIYQNCTLAQPYFLGDSFKSSKGFFPTELGFSERLIPVLNKLGITWSVLGNVHYSRTLKDYPYLNDPGKDCLISPPNRADLQNTSSVGSWVSLNMFNEQQVTHNKFPFASIPHWVRYVDPETGQETRIAGIPVEQASSWEEGYQGSVTAAAIKPYDSVAASLGRKQYFVIAHDGDNSSGRAGDGGTWANSGNVTYADSGVTGMGVDEYLLQNPIPSNDVVHVQDGSWIDTRDSSSDPQWHHWKLPFGIWKGQFADFNKAMGTSYAPKKNMSGVDEGMTVSFEYGYHYLERNFALLQAALNYAKTAEQIWLDAHPTYWSPKTTLDSQVTYAGNQLNPWMISYPVKGDPAKDYAGGANPAELAWYFLLPAIDSGFGYYDENQDDGVKPTLSFNQSLYFSQPYVNARLAQDKTGPSVWWPQRWPYNPGSVNCDKSEGWTTHYFDNTFAIYTYAYDVNGISSIKLKVRKHHDKVMDATDNTFKVYDPAKLKAAGIANIDTTRVGTWVDYSMLMRDLKPDINGVAWQASSTDMFKRVPAKEIGNLYYTYLSDFQDELVDYYIEAVDTKGNVTKSVIQTVYVGAGKYNNVGGKIIEDINGTIKGTYPFVTAPSETVKPVVSISAPTNGSTVTNSVTISATATDNVGVTKVEFYCDNTLIGTDTTSPYSIAWNSYLVANGSHKLLAKAYDAAKNEGVSTEVTVNVNNTPDITLPTVTITQPATGSTVKETITVTANATDNVGVAKVEFYLGSTKIAEDATSPYSITFDTLTVQNGTYALTAKAYDLADNSATSGSVSVTVANTANSVTIYYKPGYTTPYIHYRPAGGTWTTAPGVAIPAATDATGYYKITITIGTATQLEACFNNGSGTWDSNGGSNYLFPVGTSTYYAGKITSGAPDTTKPTVSLTAPVAGATLVGTVSVSADASDNKAVAKVEFYAGTTKIGEDTTAPYSISWDTTTVANGTYSITAKAIDTANNDQTSTAVSVTTNNPVALKKTYATMNLRGTNNAWATTAMTLIADYTWQVDATFGSTTTERFKFDVGSDWAVNFGDTNKDGIAEQGGGDISITGGAGTYRITFNDSTKAYTVVKQGGDTTKPTVSLTAPTAGSTLTGTSATVSATASDNVAVAKVEFYAGTTKIGEDTTSPYSISWNTTTVANGTYSITAKAIDTSNNEQTSTAVSVTVNNSSAVTTTIKVNYDCGYGNSIYIRGGLTPLSWTAGKVATWTTGNVWVYTTTEIPAGQTFEFKALINDVTWSDGANYTGTGGQTITINPTFTGNFYDIMDTLTNWTVSGYTGAGKWQINNYMARAYGCTSESVLTLIPSLKKLGTVTLAFKYQLAGLDTGEYLAVDVYNGSVWTQVGKYTGTVAATNVSIDVTKYASNNFKVRFRTKMSDATEYSYIDNVSIKASIP